ncbi:translational activator for mitochondrial COX1 [Rhizina undulata]
MRAPQTCQRCLSSLRPLSTFSIPRALPRTALLQWPRKSPASMVPRRSFLSVFKKDEPIPLAPADVAAMPTPKGDQSRLLLKPGNLFHPMDKSPSPSMRERAAAIQRTAYCPHTEHHQSGTPEHVAFTCPDCGVPTYCSEEHWLADYENHLLICDTLREANEDDHDLRSGRFFPEFEYPGEQMDDALINFTNWDTFLYTREFRAINDERPMRQVTRLLTYPTTIASFLHELSPYDLKHRLTVEGLKSVTALRYNLHPPKTGAGKDIKGIRLNPPPVRLFMLGARAESSLPREVWYQLTHIFPLSTFHLIFIGPESMSGRQAELPLPPREPTNPFGAVVERIAYNMKISTFVEYFHTLHEANAFAPYDLYFDCFVLFHPGLGHPGSAAEWEETLPRLLATKAPILATGYTEEDLKRDVEWVGEKCKGEYDVLLEPGSNRFRSLRWDINDVDPSDLTQGNYGVWAFRGKRYEATTKEEAA